MNNKKLNIVVFIFIVVVGLIFLVPNKCTVIFDSDGGTIINDIEIDKGKTIKEPPIPVKEGYIFVEWVFEKESFDFNDIITKDITLTAKWKKIEEKNIETYLNNVKNSSNKIIADGWEKLITKYLDMYYESLINLDTKDVTILFTKPEGNEAHYIYSAIDLLIYHHKVQQSDMRLTTVKYDIEYTKVSLNDNIITINFLVDDYMNFKYLGDIESKEIDVKYEMKIKQENDIYTIDSVRVVQGNFVMFTNELNIETTTIEKINTLKQKYKELVNEDLKENNKLMDSANKEKYTTTIECDFKYDRNKAVEYAYKYVNTRNESYMSYDNLGGNCQNYVSQCIHESGIPMDIKGKNQWKHYGGNINNQNEPKGRTPSWTGVTNFYQYVINEKENGICADVDRNIFYAELGDVAQVGYKGFSHSVIVVKEIYEKNNKIDFLVNSNTAGLENYPFMAYVYPNKRIIKILGYND